MFLSATKFWSFQDDMKEWFTLLSTLEIFILNFILLDIRVVITQET